MEYNKMRATVKGTTYEKKPFTDNIKFELIPPKEKKYYGTGYYMRVKIQDEKQYIDVRNIDVRYEKTTDIEILADRWIKSYYGENAKEITKQF